jgi:hypothetical protein
MPNASGELLAADDHPDEREKIYAVASQLDWFVRSGMRHWQDWPLCFQTESDLIDSVIPCLGVHLAGGRIMPFYVNVLLGVDAAYNHNAFVVWIALFFVFDQIVDHRFPIARLQLDPKSGPRLLELPEDSSALNVGKGFAEGSIPCNVCEQ